MHHHRCAQDSADLLERARINTTSHFLLHSDAFPSWLSRSRCHFPSSRPRWMVDEVSPISGWLIVVLLVSLSQLGFLTLFFCIHQPRCASSNAQAAKVHEHPSPLQPPPVSSLCAVWMWCAVIIFGASKQTQQSISPHSQPAKTHIDDTSVSAAAGCPVWH